MARTIAIASLALAGALLLAPSTSVVAQAARSPENVALCLPAGANGPVACGTVRAGQTIRLRVATTTLPTRLIRLEFSQQAAAGRPRRSANVIIPPAISRDGGYEVKVPEELCASAGDRLGNFEIQHLMSSDNQSETVRRSLGTITIAC